MRFTEAISELADTTSVSATLKFHKELQKALEAAMHIERAKIAEGLRKNGLHGHADWVLDGGHWDE